MRTGERTRARIGIWAVATIGVLALAGLGVGPALAISCPGATGSASPACGGGGGGEGPLVGLLFASSPSAVGAATACASDPAGECLSSFPSTYTAPVLSPTPALYGSTFDAVVSGGTGTYTYEWLWPGAGAYASGGEVETYEFTTVGTHYVTVQVSSPGVSSIAVTMPVSIGMGSPPGEGGYSYGVLGVAYSIGEPTTKWVEGVLTAGAAVAAVVAAFCPVCSPVATAVAALLAGYATWAQSVDTGQGVYFAFPYETIPYVGGNPVPWYFTDL